MNKYHNNVIGQCHCRLKLLSGKSGVDEILSVKTVSEKSVSMISMVTRKRIIGVARSIVVIRFPNRSNSKVYTQRYTIDTRVVTVLNKYDKYSGVQTLQCITESLTFQSQRRLLGRRVAVDFKIQVATR